MKGIANIVDEINDVVDLVRVNSNGILMFDDPEAPFYKYGHPVSVSNELLQMTSDNVLAYKRYPLFVLKLDTPEDVLDNIVEYDLNLAILNLTDPNYSAEERKVNSFEPMLYPLYELFIEALQQSGFFWDGEFPPHTKIDRYFWGTQSKQGNTEYLFNDPLDALEIVNLRIKKELICKP